MLKSTALFAAFFALALSFMPLTAKAEPKSYKMERVHSQIIFFIDHLGFSKSEGEFLKFEGDLMIDHEAPQNSFVNLTIHADSISMDDEKWDEHMRNADFFNVEIHPTITFTSKKVDLTGEDTANVTGDLTMLGISKEVVLAVKHNKTGIHPMNNKEIAGFSATASLKRSDFGMKYALPMVGDDVEIRIEVEAIAGEK